ncbi:hypothetical protein AMTR_s00014p00068600 [Amborella trichopoda]|uniref:Pentatricopeptide repeat-containing protein n=1 Tax=Amborella trichopoda TaxID=13333 RepID=W1PMS3_AMBTC|nr:hypothetical protein AMTR_s00014p00068600 [Amborella trichopoda]
MPQRNVTTWNSIISAYALNGQPSSALQLFLKILNMGFRPTGFTFLTILVSYVSLCHGKEAHARLIRQDLGSNLITSNALMDMYGKFGSVGYLFNMLCSMEERDRISWNTSMAGCKGEIALRLFQAMIMAGVSPDQFTLSTMITACVGLRDLRSDYATVRVFGEAEERNGPIYNAMISVYAMLVLITDAFLPFKGIMRAKIEPDGFMGAF